MAMIKHIAVLLCVTALMPALAAAQATGSIVGVVLDAQTRAPIPGVEIRIVNLPQRTTSGPDGRFVLGAVPSGERDLRAERIGYQPQIIERVPVRTARAADIRIELQPGAIALPGVVVRAERVRLIEPEISTTHEVVVAREIRELPVDRVDQVIELTTGVSEGHFRGGRVGQEVYVVDGLSLKNQFEASTAGLLLELSPSSLEEVDVITGGFGAAYGGALSGVVSYVTRRGNQERWQGRTALSTDQWAPTSIMRGFTSWSLSADGPVPLLGRGTTIFADVLAQGFLDAEPRASGLTCLSPGLADDSLASQISTLLNDDATRGLICPYTSEMLPNQQGDKYITFARLDRPFGAFNLMASLLRNRNQRELYTQEFKYNPTYQLGQSGTGTLANVSLEWLDHGATRARSLVARVAALRLDRYLGVIDPEWRNSRTTIAGFSPERFQFIGEEF